MRSDLVRIAGAALGVNVLLAHVPAVDPGDQYPCWVVFVRRIPTNTYSWTATYADNQQINSSRGRIKLNDTPS